MNKDQCFNTFTLSDEGMSNMAKLANGERRYTRTDEALDAFESWKVTYE